MVVKGGEGREVLQTRYPFEQVPTEAVKEMEGLADEVSVTLRDFFIASSSEGIAPVMGVIVPEGDSAEIQSNKNKLFKLAGSAMFKDLKLVGFLDDNETNGFLWATDRMKNGRVNAELPNDGGMVGIVLNRAKRTITSDISGDKIKIKLMLQGQGSFVENNSRLDIGRPKNLELVEKALEKSVEREVREVVTKLQKQYKVDNVGFGQAIYRSKPKQWKALKTQWESRFPDEDVAIAVKIDLDGAGMAGPPLQLNPKETIK